MVISAVVERKGTKRTAEDVDPPPCWEDEPDEDVGVCVCIWEDEDCWDWEAEAFSASLVAIGKGAEKTLGIIERAVETEEEPMKEGCCRE